MESNSHSTLQSMDGAGMPLSVPATRLAAVSIADNTKAAYSGALAALNNWLGGRALSDTLLADYLADRFTNGAAPASLSLIVSAVRFVGKLKNQPTIIGPYTERTLAGIRRQGRTRGRGQAIGLSWENVAAIVAITERDQTIAGQRDSAIIRIMSDGLLRIGELVALNIEDLQFSQDGSGTCAIHHSKTDQLGRGAVVYLGPPTVQAIVDYCHAAGIQAGPLFRRMYKGDSPGQGRLTVRGVRNVIQKRAAAAGVDGIVRGHSLRIGSAQSLVKSGASLPELQQAGRWSDSQMPAHYSRNERALRGPIARHKYGRD